MAESTPESKETNTKRGNKRTNDVSGATSILSSAALEMHRGRLKNDFPATTYERELRHCAE
jgi:hypothetical protein